MYKSSYVIKIIKRYSEDYMRLEKILKSKNKDDIEYLLTKIITRGEELVYLTNENNEVEFSKSFKETRKLISGQIKELKELRINFNDGNLDLSRALENLDENNKKNIDNEIKINTLKSVVKRGLYGVSRVSEYIKLRMSSFIIMITLTVLVFSGAANKVSEFVYKAFENEIIALSLTEENTSNLTEENTNNLTEENTNNLTEENTNVNLKILEVLLGLVIYSLIIIIPLNMLIDMLYIVYPSLFQNMEKLKETDKSNIAESLISLNPLNPLNRLVSEDAKKAVIYENQNEKSEITVLEKKNIKEIYNELLNLIKKLSENSNIYKDMIHKEVSYLNTVLLITILEDISSLNKEEIGSLLNNRWYTID